MGTTKDCAILMGFLYTLLSQSSRICISSKEGEVEARLQEGVSVRVQTPSRSCHSSHLIRWDGRVLPWAMRIWEKSLSLAFWRTSLGRSRQVHTKSLVLAIDFWCKPATFLKAFQASNYPGISRRLDWIESDINEKPYVGKLCCQYPESFSLV